MSTAPLQTLASVDQVADAVGRPGVVIADCRYNLMDPQAGRRAHLEAHVPGAIYVHLSDDMSGPPLSDHGRHPLPSPEALTTLFSRLGISAGTQVFAYDDIDAGIAARLWWLLRYMGHPSVAVMDGGFRAWREANQAVESGEVSAVAAEFSGSPRRDWLVTIEQVPQAVCLVDARLSPRYRGDEEPLDPVAGHIPGARSHPYRDNLQASGRFLPKAQLAAAFSQTLGEHPPKEAVYYCGSGVTACQLLLAAAHAGLPPGKLYAGSWSEWCSDPARPVARGDDPGCRLRQ